MFVVNLKYVNLLYSTRIASGDSWSSQAPLPDGISNHVPHYSPTNVKGNFV